LVAFRGFVAVTDLGWITSLRALGPLEEINFWQPSPSTLNLAIGTPFFFKAKAPINAITGVGFFAHYSVVDISTAWDLFGRSNGVDSLIHFRERVMRLGASDARRNHLIGCIMLAQPKFFREDDYVRIPSDFQQNIVRGRYYDLTTGEGAVLWAAVERRIRIPSIGASPMPQVTIGEPVLIAPRLGQGIFRSEVLDAYGRRCAITGERTLPALEAAHIIPFSVKNKHELTNGIALRSDIHRLFDRGYVTIDTDRRFRVSSRIKEEFENGGDYYALHEKAIRLPTDSEAHPATKSFEWHINHLYRGD